MITRFDDDVPRRWNSGAPEPSELQEPFETRQRAVLPALAEGPRWEPPVGLQPVGEGWIADGHLYQPCLHAVTPTIVGEYHTFIDYKLGLVVAKIGLPDLEAHTLIDCSPVACTLDGYYNIAHHDNSPWIRYSSESSPWGDLVDAGAPYLDVHREGSIVVPKLLGANQLWAVDLSTGAEIWREDGWAGFPQALIDHLVGLEPIDGQLPFDPATEYVDYTYTVLGPGAPGTILVHVVSRTLIPSIAPDWNARVSWAAMDGGVTQSFHGPLYGKWQWSPQRVTATPGGSPPTADLFDLGGFGMVQGSPLLSQTLSEDGTPRAGRHPSRVVAVAQMASCLQDCQELADLPQYIAHFAHQTSARIEVRRLSDGEILSTLPGEMPILTGQRNRRGFGLVVQTQHTAAEVDDWPVHPRDPSVSSNPDWTPDVPGRRFFYPPDSTVPDRSGGTYEASEPTLLHYITRLISPALPPGWSQVHLLRSADSGTAPQGYGPAALYIASNPSGEPVFSATFEGYAEQDCDVWLTRCYSPLAESQNIAPPWAFDPCNYATDGRVAIFCPGAHGHQRMDLTTEARSLPDGYAGLPSWGEEVARQHRIRCYSLGPSEEYPEDAAAWTLLWEVNTLALCGAGTLYDGRAHPNCGDVLSNPVIYGDWLLCVAHGADGQRLLGIRIRGDEDTAAGTVAINRVIGPSILRDGGYVGGNNGNTVAVPGRLCHRYPNRWHDTLQVVGADIYGCDASGRWWRLS